MYLRVKNWRKHQHYAKRQPPWIKLCNELLQDDSFQELSEGEQWQLARIWLVASLSTRYAADDAGKPVPVVPRDEQTLRRSIRSLKRIPVAKFERVGWLIPVHHLEVKIVAKQSELADLVLTAQASIQAKTPLDIASTIASSLASTGASTLLGSEVSEVVSVIPGLCLVPLREGEGQDLASSEEQAHAAYRALKVAEALAKEAS